MIWAGGGVIRANARHAVLALAELLDAPVATTYMGKGAIADSHPLAVGCGCDEAAFMELLAEADVVLCVGTELGAETTSQYALSFDGAVIHLDAEPARIGATYESLGLVGDARATLGALVDELGRRPTSVRARAAPPRCSASRPSASRIAEGLAAQGRSLELGLLSTLEEALGADAIGCFDMTILGYWAAPHLRIADGQQFLYPLGSGTLGYAWPAAIGASVAHPDRQVLAVVGDGGFQYAVAELGTAAQHGIDAKLLIVDDGGYGILREYQRDAFGETTAVELPGKDLVAVAAAYGVPVRAATPDDLGEQLAWAFAQDGPAVVVLRALLARPRRRHELGRRDAATRTAERSSAPVGDRRRSVCARRRRPGAQGPHRAHRPDPTELEREPARAAGRRARRGRGVAARLGLGLPRGGLRGVPVGGRGLGRRRSAPR